MLSVPIDYDRDITAASKADCREPILISRIPEAERTALSFEKVSMEQNYWGKTETEGGNINEGIVDM